MTCVDKLRALHALLGVVVKNTKADTLGKRSEPQKETAATKRLLKSLLGRTPTQIEIDLVLADNWPANLPKDKCCS